MHTEFTVAITGDSIIRTKPSLCGEERFLALIQILRDADVAYTQLEMPVHDFEGPELYPAAEGGHNWARAPRHVVEDLKWAGFDIVSTASNHSLDYSYGGLYSTWKALNDAKMPYAGTGMNLAEARDPAYLETPKGRVALVSMCSSFVRWSRAGEARRDMKGRPGINPLRFYHLVDADTMESLKQLAVKLGWWVEHYDRVWILTQPGAQNTIYKFAVRDAPGVTTVADEDDAEGNLRSIRFARRQADYVVAHLHSHDFHPEKGLSVPPDFIPPFARASIDAGADVFVAQGSHAPLRGIEIYQGKPIFYDLGDFIGSNAAHTPKLPAEFYFRAGYSHYNPDIRRWEATAADAYAAMKAYDAESVVNPPGGVRTAPVGKAAIAAVCTFGEGRRLTGLKLYPATYLDEPVSQRGIPVMANAEKAKKIIEYVAGLSAVYGTEVTFQDGIGLVKL
jgi:poly-gamma-glutamate synthesis protein (capsule biosynthesis protein)